MDIKILPPDVNESFDMFTIIDEKTIRFGLLGVKGLGKIAANAVITEREKCNKFSSIFDFVTKLDSKHINKKLMEALICSGAFDSFQHTRGSLYQFCENLIQYGNKINSDKSAGQNALFSSSEQHKTISIPFVTEWKNEKKMMYEKKSLGLYLSSHPLNEYRSSLYKNKKIVSIAEIDDGVSSEKFFDILCVIESIQNAKTSRKISFVNITVSDLTGKEQIRYYNNNNQVPIQNNIQENDVILVNCKAIFFRENGSVSTIISANNIEKINQNNVHKILQRNLHIQLPNWASKEMKNKLQNIKKILHNYRGECPVYIHLSNEKENSKIMQTHRNFFVSYNKKLCDDIFCITQSSKIAWEFGNKIIRYNN